MSKKDYELIARVLRREHASLQLIRALAEALRTTNPRFDPWKFISQAYTGNLELIPSGAA